MSAKRVGGLAAAAVVSAVLAIVLVGCGGPAESIPAAQQANAERCGGEECHDANVGAMGGAVHSSLDCRACHTTAGDEHAKNPKTVAAGINWTIDACSGCHGAVAATYLYDDNAQPGPFGGSQRKPPQPKDELFPKYDTIVAGHAFTRDYNEEGAHRYMLQDHYETLRGKFETCMQCKSTKVAYAWDSGKPLTVGADTEIELTHTATGTVPAKKVTIPKGTQVTWATDPETRRVDAKAKLPDGKQYTSQPAASEDATANYNMLWAATVAVTKDTWPYGAGCNHCHDPHTTRLRVVRKAMISSIEGTGGPTGGGGVNPYAEDPVKSFDEAVTSDREILTCAQCHVEYTCGKSGVDGIDRDAFGWAKASDLHELYTKQFGYSQDWKHAIIGQPLIKSQHPETELFWESTHYSAGVSCSDCHMPEVRVGSERFASHWFTSPYKYRDTELFARFAEKTGVSVKSQHSPCTRCHSDRTERAIAQQKEFFALQAQVEKLLAASVAGLGAVPAPERTSAEYGRALDAHRQAHVLWENLAVSENSMGFHNFGESMASMREAATKAKDAIALERQLTKD